MHHEQRIAEVNGTHLYYEVAGAGEPLVLIHGFGLDRRMWDDQFEVLALRYRVLRFDARGFGRSALPASEPSDEPYSHAADLKALLDHLALGPAHLAGLSMGGLIAIDFALTYPEATRTLIPVDSIVGGMSWIYGGLDGYSAARERARGGDMDGAKDIWIGDPFFAPAREQPTLATRLHDMIRDYTGWHWLNADPHRDVDPPAAKRLGEIAVPVCILVGERDVADCQAVAVFLRERIPHARLVEMPGVGHMSPMEDPAGFNRIVKEFLGHVS